MRFVQDCPEHGSAVHDAMTVRSCCVQASRRIVDTSDPERVRVGNPDLNLAPRDFSPGFRITHEMLANVPDQDFLRIVGEEMRRRDVVIELHQSGLVRLVHE